MSRLSDTDIREFLLRRSLRIEPQPTGSDIQPASVELHLDTDIIANPVDKTHRAIRRSLADGYIYPLLPGESVLASTVEKVAVPPDLVGEVWGKSSLARIFLQVHCTAGYIDPGFVGKITLELTNLSNEIVELRAGMKIAQIAFDELRTPATLAYGDPALGSHYQNQTAVQQARFDGEETYL